MAILRKNRKPLTKYQRGRRYAIIMLVIGVSLSIAANVISSDMTPLGIGVSAPPPIIAFFTVHLLNYVRTRNWFQKLLTWGGLGLVVLVALGTSYDHIMDVAARGHQPFYIVIFYPIIIDFPMVVAGTILAQNPDYANTVNRELESKKPQSSVKLPQPRQSRQTPAKSTKLAAKTARPASTPKPSIHDMTDDEFEKEFAGR